MATLPAYFGKLFRSDLSCYEFLKKKKLLYEKENGQILYTSNQNEEVCGIKKAVLPL